MTREGEKERERENVFRQNEELPKCFLAETRAAKQQAQ
jgi:hypothetical protein